MLQSDFNFLPMINPQQQHGIYENKMKITLNHVEHKSITESCECKLHLHEWNVMEEDDTH